MSGIARSALHRQLAVVIGVGRSSSQPPPMLAPPLHSCTMSDISFPTRRQCSVTLGHHSSRRPIVWLRLT
jgi:hypothetical protein